MPTTAQLADGTAQKEDVIEGEKDRMAEQAAVTIPKKRKPHVRHGVADLHRNMTMHGALAAVKHGIHIQKAIQAVQQKNAEPMITMSHFGGKVIINDAQYLLYKSEFDEADGNQDGKLEGPEIRTLLKSKLGEDATHGQIEEWMERFDSNHDGSISLEEWIHGIIGKDFSVSHTVVKMVKLGTNAAPDSEADAKPTTPLPEDKDGNPMCIGLVYQFTGGGGYGGDVCVFRGMRSKGSGLLVSKSTTYADGIGEFTGHGIVTRSFGKLKLTTEKLAWVNAQERALVEVDFFRNTGDPEGAAIAMRAMREYKEYTGTNLFLQRLG